MKPPVARALQPFGTTIFTTMTRMAQRHGAVNLSQGFPDFEGPDFVKDAARDALYHQHNQYAPMPGIPALRNAIAQRFTRDTGIGCDPETGVVVTAGCTEAIAATLLGTCDPGDEVILFEPYYDSYRACVAMAGCVPVFVPLMPPSGLSPGESTDQPFTFDPQRLADAFSPRTKAIIVNTPHNPTGKVFTRDELALIADLCERHDVYAICDEVYERLTLTGARHLSLATMPGMAERTITLSSLGKTFSLTGWKIGWAVASPPLIAAIRCSHQFLTFAVATPLQHAAAVALSREHEYVPSLVGDLKARRDELAPALRRLGMRVYMPQGTYFILADQTSLAQRLNAADDQQFCMTLIERAGVAAIPPSAFYENKGLGRPLVRFAFCKKPETIALAVQRLDALAMSLGLDGSRS